MILIINGMDIVLKTFMIFMILVLLNLLMQVIIIVLLLLLLLQIDHLVFVNIIKIQKNMNYDVIGEHMKL